MDKIRSAAIILLGLGEKYTGDILKTMTPKEVKLILEAINQLDDVTEQEVASALKEFFQQTTGHLGIDTLSKEHVKHSILASVGSSGGLLQGIDVEKDTWLELVKLQPPEDIVDLMQDEHPQVITALVMIVFNYISSDYGSRLVKAFPKVLQSQIFKRMTGMSTISRFAIDVFAIVFERELQDGEKNSAITLDGLDTVANIISYLDSDTEREIMKEITSENKELGEKIQDKMFPFSRLAEIDNKSMQVLLKEVKNEDLVIALKGVEENVRNIFFQNMSSKSAEILKDEMQTKGPVKLALVLDAQKRIIRIAKKLDEEEKIVLSSKNNSGVVF